MDRLPALCADAPLPDQPDGVFSRTGGDLDAIGRPDPWPGHVSPGYTLDPDGVVIAGLCVRTNYDGTEEAGAARLLQAFADGQQAAGVHRVSVCSDVRALAVSTHELAGPEFTWGAPLSTWDRADVPQRYAEDFDAQVDYSRGGAATTLQAATVPELRVLARAAGVRPLPRRRADLVAAVRPTLTVARPDNWPAMFGGGATLVLRADDDRTGPSLTARLLDQLIDAARAGSLAVGNGSGPFTTGLFLHDERDQTPELRRVIDLHRAWAVDREAEVAPVREELTRRGVSIYSLQRAREGGWTRRGDDGSRVVEDGRPRWWLNASVRTGTGRGQSVQVFGWLTLDELTVDGLLELGRAQEAQRATRAGLAAS